MKLLLVISTLLTLACSHNAYTPPSRTMALASPQTLQKDEAKLRANVTGSADLFGPAVAAASGGYRRGMDEELELEVDLSYFQVMDRSTANTTRGIAMARVGGKYRPTQSAHLALVAGAGGGYSPAAGAYLSGDLGVVVGYENRYVVPYLSAGVFGSVPLNPRAVNVTGVEDQSTFMDTPENTVGLSVGAGLKIPVRSAALLLGLSNTRLMDNDSEDDFLSVGAGVETSF